LHRLPPGGHGGLRAPLRRLPHDPALVGSVRQLESWLSSGNIFPFSGIDAPFVTVLLQARA
jgi:hypothetical protein